MFRAFALIMSRLFKNSESLSVFLKFRFSLIWFLLLSFSSDLQLQYLFGCITEVTMDNKQASREFIQLKKKKTNSTFSSVNFWKDQFPTQFAILPYNHLCCHHSGMSVNDQSCVTDCNYLGQKPDANTFRYFCLLIEYRGVF